MERIEENTWDEELRIETSTIIKKVFFQFYLETTEDTRHVEESGGAAQSGITAW